MNYMDRVVMEIVQTEGVYVRDLQHVIEVSGRNEELRECTNDTVYNAAMRHCTQYHFYTAVSQENAF
jgi:hypothetical protein